MTVLMFISLLIHCEWESIKHLCFLFSVWFKLATAFNELKQAVDFV